jgi:CRISPR-associated exonuclease Cas4
MVGNLVSNNLHSKTNKNGLLRPYILPSGKAITGTIVWYFFICKREVWLMGREITPDQDFEPLDIGRAIHETFYDNFKKEVALDSIKLDFIKRKGMIVCEVKTSSKFLEATEFQTLYYLYRLKEYGITAKGEILIPKERKRIEVSLNAKAEEKLLKVFEEIYKIVKAEKPLPPIKTSFCKRCAYKDFCWV